MLVQFDISLLCTENVLDSISFIFIDTFIVALDCLVAAGFGHAQCRTDSYRVDRFCFPFQALLLPLEMATPPRNIVLLVPMGLQVCAAAIDCINVLLDLHDPIIKAEVPWLRPQYWL